MKVSVHFLSYDEENHSLVVKFSTLVGNKLIETPPSAFDVYNLQSKDFENLKSELCRIGTSVLENHIRKIDFSLNAEYISDIIRNVNRNFAFDTSDLDYYGNNMIGRE
jgi:hypothetical protein